MNRKSTAVASDFGSDSQRKSRRAWILPYQIIQKNRPRSFNLRVVSEVASTRPHDKRAAFPPCGLRRKHRKAPARAAKQGVLENPVFACQLHLSTPLLILSKNLSTTARANVIRIFIKFVPFVQRQPFFPSRHSILLRTGLWL